MAKKTGITTPEEAIKLFEQREAARAALQKQAQVIIKSKIEEHLRNHFRPGFTSVFELRVSEFDEKNMTRETMEAVRQLYCKHGWECKVENRDFSAVNGTKFIFSEKKSKCEVTKQTSSKAKKATKN